MNKTQLKNIFKKHGIKVKGNVISKKEMKRFLLAYVPSGSEKPVNVDCMFSEIYDPSHKTHALHTYYVSYDKLPKCVKDLFEKATPEIDESRYTVGEPTAFLRVSVITKDKAEIDMEVHLGKLEEPSEDEDDEETSEESGEEEKEEIDRDAYFADMAAEMKATFDWRLQDVYFEVMQEPEEEEEVTKVKAKLLKDLKSLSIPTVKGRYIKKQILNKALAKIAKIEKEYYDVKAETTKEFENDPTFYENRGFGPTSIETELWLDAICSTKGPKQKEEIQKLLESVDSTANERYIKNYLAARRISTAEASEEIPEDIKSEIKKYLEEKVKELQKSLKIAPEDYIEPGSEDPSIDIRLQWHDGEWQVWTGLSDYDTDHRGYWGASSVTLDTKANKLAEDLFEQVEMEMNS